MTIDQIAVQLYTVRSLCQTPAETAATLKEIRAIGYTAIEVAGICQIPADELLKMASDNGLTICAMHGDAAAILDEPLKVAEQAAALKCDYAVYSYPMGFNLGERGDVQKLTGKLSEAGATYRAAGITLCYHHHSLEFARYGNGTVMDHLVESVDPKHLSFELDTYWLQHGGGTPSDWCARLKNRVPILHMKDYGNIGGTPTMMEVGNGNLEWRKIISAAEGSGTQWFVVEQDTCPGNPLDSLKASFDYIRLNLF
jgi:sugar phosphate isomerase/epimerase